MVIVRDRCLSYQRIRCSVCIYLRQHFPVRNPQTHTHNSSHFICTMQWIRALQQRVPSILFIFFAISLTLPSKIMPSNKMQKKKIWRKKIIFNLDCVAQSVWGHHFFGFRTMCGLHLTLLSAFDDLNKMCRRNALAERKWEDLSWLKCEHDGKTRVGNVGGLGKHLHSFHFFLF